MSGVYIIENTKKSTEDKLYVKIGCSKNVEQRIKQIERSFRFNGNLDKIRIYKIIECKEYRTLERLLHSCLRSKNIVNEWFLTEEEFLLNRLSMIDLSRY